MVPVEVLPSPQLMVAVKAPAGSTPLACVKVATWPENVACGVDVFHWVAAETTIAGSRNDVGTLALLLAELESGVLLLTEAVSLVLLSSMAWAVTDAVTLPPEATVPTLKVT